MDSATGVHIIAATAGFAGLALLWLCVLWGVMLRAGWAATRIRHSTLYAVHGTLSLLGLTLSVVHGLAQLAAPAGSVRWVDELIPFINPVDPIGIGLGVLALEIIISIAVSITIQRRLGFNRWRGLHSFAYLAFTMACGHVLISGSDVWPMYVWLPVLIAWGSTLALGVFRVFGPGQAIGRVADQLAERRQNRQMTVQVDPVHCARFGFCEHEAPEVFALRPEGTLEYLSTVKPEHVDAVARAAAACPARAILFGPRTTTAVIPPPPQPLPDLEPDPEPTPIGAYRTRRRAR